jgi:thiopeptide-type bacteriocin biosynthesis protein
LSSSNQFLITCISRGAEVAGGNLSRTKPGIDITVHHNAAAAHCGGDFQAVEQAVQPLVEGGLVRRFTFDTYEREIERYGGTEALTLAEQWFWADSDAMVSVLEALGPGDAGAELRWRVGILGTDALLADLGLEVEGRAEVMRAVRQAFGREFRVDAAFRKQLAGKYRAVRQELAPVQARLRLGG